jgi:hypothetical protein
MRLNDKKIFTDKKVLEKMLDMRRNGWGYVNLGIVFGVDFSTIYYECKKAGIKVSATKTLKIDNIIKNVIKYPKERIVISVR